MSDHHVIRRNDHVVAFDTNRIVVAITKAFLAAEGGQSAASARVRQIVGDLAAQVVEAVTRRTPGGGSIHIEDIQDQVELALMRAGHHETARRYVLHREDRTRERARKHAGADRVAEPAIRVRNGEDLEPLDEAALEHAVRAACEGPSAEADAAQVLAIARRDLYDGMPVEDLQKCLILAARSLIEKEPAYSKVTARLLLHSLRHEVLGEYVSQDAMQDGYHSAFHRFIEAGIEAELLDERLKQFDLDKLGCALHAERDLKFGYLGLQTLYDRYFLQVEGRRIELPQVFFMRVAMGLSLNEIDREGRAIEFYHLLSSFDFMSSTPTLFNAGTRHPQLSSCYLTTTQDDLDSIYQSIKENALLQKFAGGLGNDWTPVRALGSHIKGTNGKSQGIVPFLKVVNDTAVAVNQGGKRKGAVCSYLETWHMDIEEFLELRKNTGDDRRRTHDMNTANWIPDLFMKRVEENGDWTLFSPSDVPELHDLYGKAFEDAYTVCEEKAARGEIRNCKRIPAVTLWRKMLSMLFETGHPWIAFKDPCNIRSPQGHVGIVHSSNLCTEITLNTSASETAVCNLGSVNLVNHLTDDGLDLERLQKTVVTAMRMLDNVIDVNFYPVEKARRSNLRHRPVGLGIMGFQDCLHVLQIPYASEEAVQFADRSMEAVTYYAFFASTDLAEERGRYSTFAGSTWDRGLLPLDTIDLLADERGGYLDVDRSLTLDWDALRTRIREVGMRNSNCIAIAPTATIANIVGVSASVEPIFQNLFVKSNLSGEFTVVNEYLVRDLKALGLWDEVMISDLKYFDGALGQIDRVPTELRERYATAFELDADWLVRAAARRQKWIDQSQSLNLYVAGASGRKLDELYRLAWRSGLKTTYYLRTLSASSAEKSTGKGGELNAVSAGDAHEQSVPTACAIDDAGCESCQ